MIAAKNGDLHLSDGVAPYDLATPLFSDYALKLRTVWAPDGAAANYDARDAFDFPVGTLIGSRIICVYTFRVDTYHSLTRFS